MKRFASETAFRFEIDGIGIPSFWDAILGRADFWADTWEVGLQAKTQVEPRLQTENGCFLSTRSHRYIFMLACNREMGEYQSAEIVGSQTNRKRIKRNASHATQVSDLVTYQLEPALEHSRKFEVEVDVW